jgi:hypothetical protein
MEWCALKAVRLERVEVGSVVAQRGAMGSRNHRRAGPGGRPNVTLSDGVRLGRPNVAPGRASLEARLATARLEFSVDFNVGDPVIPAPIRTAIPVLLGDETIEAQAYPKVMIVAEKLVTALQRGRASTRWRDFADLFMLVPGDLIESEIIEALRAVAEHRKVPLRPLGEVLEGMPQEAQARWATWRDRQGAQDRVPEDFATVLDALDERTRAWFSKATE